jgi:hypothetical protein
MDRKIKQLYNLCKHCQNPNVQAFTKSFIHIFSFHNSVKHAKKRIYEMGMYQNVERQFLHKTNKHAFRIFFKKTEMKKT